MSQTSTYADTPGPHACNQSPSLAHRQCGWPTSRHITSVSHLTQPHLGVPRSTITGWSIGFHAHPSAHVVG
jgi:hypothetical protein